MVLIDGASHTYYQGTAKGLDTQPGFTYAVGIICLTWYIFIVLVSTTGYIQL